MVNADHRSGEMVESTLLNIIGNAQRMILGCIRPGYTEHDGLFDMENAMLRRETPVSEAVSKLNVVDGLFLARGSLVKPVAVLCTSQHVRWYWS